jgi:hypothetical protein
MSARKFEALFRGLFERIECVERIERIEQPAAHLPAKGVRRFSVTLGDVVVEVSFDPERSPASALITTTFGELPQQSQHLQLAAVRALMDANYLMMGLGASVFCQDPQSGRVLLQYALPLSDKTSVDDLHQGVLEVARYVRLWRQEHLLAAPVA